MRFSEIRVKRIRVNQGLGVFPMHIFAVSKDQRTPIDQHLKDDSKINLLYINT